MPTHEECYWVMLALNALSTFDDMSFRRMAKAEKDGKRPFVWVRYEEKFNRDKSAWASDPKAWVGWNNDPSNPEFLQRREGAKRIVQAAIDGKLPKTT